MIRISLVGSRALYYRERARQDNDIVTLSVLMSHFVVSGNGIGV